MKEDLGKTCALRSMWLGLFCLAIFFSSDANPYPRDQPLFMFLASPVSHSQHQLCRTYKASHSEPPVSCARFPRSRYIRILQLERFLEPVFLWPALAVEIRLHRKSYKWVLIEKSAEKSLCWIDIIRARSDVSGLSVLSVDVGGDNLRGSRTTVYFRTTGYKI